MRETLRPGPSFHPCARLAMQAEAERIACTVLLCGLGRVPLPGAEFPAPGVVRPRLGLAWGASLVIAAAAGIGMAL